MSVKHWRSHESLKRSCGMSRILQIWMRHPTSRESSKIMIFLFKIFLFIHSFDTNLDFESPKIMILSRESSFSGAWIVPFISQLLKGEAQIWVYVWAWQVNHHFQRLTTCRSFQYNVSVLQLERDVWQWRIVGWWSKLLMWFVTCVTYAKRQCLTSF